MPLPGARADKIVMTRFGKMGRFGNQIFQVMFMKTYAKRHGLQVQLPAWVGNQIYGVKDHPVTGRKLPVVREKNTHGVDDTIIPHAAKPYRNVDFCGYFQYHTSYYRPDKDYICKLFTPCNAVRNRMQPSVEAWKASGETRVGLHLRRGDYGRGCFYITPVSWYLEQLEKIWPGLQRPALFIATEDISLVKEFSKYNPVTVEDLGVNLQKQPLLRYNYLRYDKQLQDPRALDFYPDFHMLTQCDVLLIPNSTFSFAAAMLSPTLQAAYRSVLVQQTFIPFDPWDAQPSQYERVEDHPEIPDVRLESNPYWRR